MQRQIEDLLEHFESLQRKIVDPELVMDQSRYKEVAKEFKRVEPIVELYRELESCQVGLNDTQEILDDDETDEEMLEMASLGAKVMQPVSIQDARLNRIDIEVKSSFIKKPGTLITGKSNIINNKIITGISLTHNDSKVTLVGVKDRPGVAASIFKPLSINSINVDMVVQNISPNGKETDLTFTIKAEELNKTKKIIQENKSINFSKKQIFLYFFIKYESFTYRWSRIYWVTYCSRVNL